MGGMRVGSGQLVVEEWCGLGRMDPSRSFGMTRRDCVGMTNGSCFGMIRGASCRSNTRSLVKLKIKTDLPCTDLLPQFQVD